MEQLVQFGPAGACVAIVVVFLKYLKDDNARRDKINEHMTKAINTMAKSNDKVAKEIRQGNQEAKERNGHLGEQNVQITQIVEKIASKLPEQHVDKQVVEHQIVKDKE